MHAQNVQWMCAWNFVSAEASARAKREKCMTFDIQSRFYPGSLTAIPFILQDLPGAPGCSREITREDSRVKFPKSLPAFYPRFYPRDLSYYKITRVHPGKNLLSVKGVLVYEHNDLAFLFWDIFCGACSQWGELASIIRKGRNFPNYQC